MYIEKRKLSNITKYYLVHSYREGNSVRKIRKYLGSNLTIKELKNSKKIAEEKIKQLLKDLSTEVFLFSLTNKQIESLNKLGRKLSIFNLSKAQWKRFTADFVYNTNAIEGSTVTEQEVIDLLSKKKPKNKEEIETKGVAEAIDYITTTKEDLSLNFILKLHKLCFKDSKSFAGKFRKVNVVIRDSTSKVVHSGVPKEQLKDYLEDLIKWYTKNKNKFNPLILAAIIHNQFEHIHPFQDGNGRVGRLLLNFILLKNKYPPINILLEDRLEYYLTLQNYSKKQDLKSTLKFLIKQYKKTLKKVSTKNKK